jgi:phi13 family phage major tail protein
MAMRIGCDHLVYAIMTTEDTESTAPVYGDVKTAPGVMHVNINPNASLATAFFDDGPGDTASTLGNIDVEIQKNTLTAENKADLLGHEMDANGGIVYADDDSPPFVALGFRTLKSNGKYRYVWLYKGRFADPEDNNETKADSINFQSDTVSGQFVKLAYPTVVNGKSKRSWKYEIDSDTPEASQGVMDAWFDDVVFPSSADVVAPPIVAAFAPGTALNSTKATITGAAGAGNHFAVKVSGTEITTPDVGDLITGLAVYASAGDISDVTAGQYVGLYEVTATDTAVKFLGHLLIEDDIKLT